jgi:glycosyltransferase involved in cell wall biosynthesis
LVGVGENADALKVQAAELGIAERVLFLGPRSDIPELLNSFDVFVLPSSTLDETLGIVVLEAMACGVPCVVTDLPGPSRIAADGTFAVVVPCQDPRALSEALIELHDNGDARDHFSTVGLQRAAECERGVVLADLLRRIGVSPA